MATLKVILIHASQGLNRSIHCPVDQSIGDAGADQDMDLPVSCRVGACSSDAGKRISGSISEDDQAFLAEDQIAAGYRLT